MQDRAATSQPTTSQPFLPFSSDTRLFLHSLLYLFSNFLTLQFPLNNITIVLGSLINAAKCDIKKQKPKSSFDFSFLFFPVTEFIKER